MTIAITLAETPDRNGRFACTVSEAGADWLAAGSVTHQQEVVAWALAIVSARRAARPAQPHIPGWGYVATACEQRA